MGIADRDYMRDRHRAAAVDNPFTPTKPEVGWPTLILFWLGVALVLYKIYGYLPARVHQRAAPIPQATATATAQRPVVTEAPRSVPQRVTAPPPTATVSSPPVTKAYAIPSNNSPQGTITKCVQNGTTTYSERGCADGSPAMQIGVTSRSGGNTAGDGRIYLCKAYNGGTFWASNHCNQHSALIERIENVPPGMPFDQQVNLARQRQQQREAPVSTTNVTVTQALPDNRGAMRAAECKALDARIVQLDDMARQPQSPQMQDWIRAERQAARDRQFRIPC